MRYLGCKPGRSSDTWFDFDLFGHQLSAHLRAGGGGAATSGSVDGETVPIPHFGVLMTMDDWQALPDRLEGAGDIDWIHRPMRRFAGQPGEQATLFIRDPSGNALEFKGFASLDAVFEN